MRAACQAIQVRGGPTSAQIQAGELSAVGQAVHVLESVARSQIQGGELRAVCLFIKVVDGPASAQFQAGELCSVGQDVHVPEGVARS